jgi:hypothetical protein
MMIGYVRKTVPVPLIRLRLWLGVCLAALMAGPSLFAARPGPKPSQRIDLGALGYEPVQAGYLLSGGTMFTVDFVDRDHLLVTWSARGLLKRLAEDPPNDQDRNVDAVLLELPTGKVLARTRWRMHDHGAYLWPIGGGQFLLRVEHELSVIAPLRDVAKPDPFAGQNAIHTVRPIGFVFVSPDDKVLTLETFAPPDPGLKAGDQILRNGVNAVQINFFRIAQNEATGKVALVGAGVFRAADPVRLPLTGGGYLTASKDKAGGYLFDFVPFIGKRIELAGFETSCAPAAHFVSSTDFVAFGCRGSADRQEMGFFNLRGDAPWVSNFSNQHINPSIVAAPGTGRFALGRTIVNSTPMDLESLTAAEVVGQEITVFQGYDGRPLLKLMATPVQRAGGNFDLSTDGSELAMFHDGAVEIYQLPELTGKDRADVEASRKVAPPDSMVPIRMSRDHSEAASAEDAGAAAAAPAAFTATIVNGDDQPAEQSGHRKPPSLYGPDYPNPDAGKTPK